MGSKVVTLEARGVRRFKARMKKLFLNWWAKPSSAGLLGGGPDMLQNRVCEVGLLCGKVQGKGKTSARIAEQARSADSVGCENICFKTRAALSIDRDFRK